MSLLDSTLSKKKSDALFVNINDLGILWKVYREAFYAGREH